MDSKPIQCRFESDPGHQECRSRRRQFLMPRPTRRVRTSTHVSMLRLHRPVARSAAVPLPARPGRWSLTRSTSWRARAAPAAAARRPREARALDRARAVAGRARRCRPAATDPRHLHGRARPARHRLTAEQPVDGLGRPPRRRGDARRIRRPRQRHSQRGFWVNRRTCPPAPGRTPSGRPACGWTR